MVINTLGGSGEGKESTHTLSCCGRVAHVQYVEYACAHEWFSMPLAMSDILSVCVCVCVLCFGRVLISLPWLGMLLNKTENIERFLKFQGVTFKDP